MALLLLTALALVWALGAILAVSLCVASGRADRGELAARRSVTGLRLVPSR